MHPRDERERALLGFGVTQVDEPLCPERDGRFEAHVPVQIGTRERVRPTLRWVHAHAIERREQVGALPQLLEHTAHGWRQPVLFQLSSAEELDHDALLVGMSVVPGGGVAFVYTEVGTHDLHGALAGLVRQHVGHHHVAVFTPGAPLVLGEDVLLGGDTRHRAIPAEHHVVEARDGATRGQPLAGAVDPVLELGQRGPCAQQVPQRGLQGETEQVKERSIEIRLERHLRRLTWRDEQPRPEARQVHHAMSAHIR